MANIINEMRIEIDRDDLYGPFNIDDAEAFLDSVPHEQFNKN